MIICDGCNKMIRSGEVINVTCGGEAKHFCSRSCHCGRIAILDCGGHEDIRYAIYNDCMGIKAYWDFSDDIPQDASESD